MRLDEIKYSLQNLLHRKMRSWLTVLSILIGVMSIFALVSFGLGIMNYVDLLSEEAGSDVLYIQNKGVGAPGTDENFYITTDEIDFLGKINGVKQAIGMYAKAGKIEHRNEIRYSFVIAFDPTYQRFIDEKFTVKVERGRPLKKGELNRVLLGHNYQLDEKVFKKSMHLGDKVLLNGELFEVVGFYEEVGNPQDDSQIYLTIEAMEKLYPATKDKYAFVMMQSQPDVDPNELADSVTKKFRKHRGLDEGKENFFIQTFADVMETFGSVMGVINAVLILISLISLVVASVNIMNTMYTAVIERTNEIGVMKAIGARNSDILFIFIFESGFLGAVGGILGVGLGYLVSSTGGNIAKAGGYAMLYPIFPWYLTVGCVLFAFFIGAIAGIMPALQASKLKPVDALRYE